MWFSKQWQSKTAWLMLLGLTSTTSLSNLAIAPATAEVASMQVAQLFQRPQRVVVPAGTQVRVSYDKAEKIIVTPSETTAVTLTVAEGVRTPSGTVVIPAGSQIEGELQPGNGGTQFVAQNVILLNGDRRIPISATSEPITERETIDRRSDPNILRGAAIGAAAAAVLAEIFGRIDVIEVLAGAGVGAVAEILLRGRREVEVVVVNPDTDLTLTLDSDFVLQ